MPNAILKYKQEDGSYREFPLAKVVTTLGRSESNDIVIKDSSLSRLHLRLENRNDEFYILDNNSSNGTFLNQQRITESQLNHGDLIRAGRILLEYVGLRSEDKTEHLVPVSTPGVDRTLIAPVMPFFESDTDIRGKKERAEGGAPAVPEHVRVRDPEAPNKTRIREPGSGSFEPQAAREPRPRVSKAPEPSAPEVLDQDDRFLDESGLVTDASTSNRLIAVALDLGVLMAFTLPSVSLGILGMAHVGLVLFIIGVIVTLVQITLGLFFYGQSAGKFLLSLRVVEQEEPERIGLSARVTLIRCSLFFLSLCLLGLPFIWVIYDEEGRAFHDRVSGTKVIVE